MDVWLSDEDLAKTAPAETRPLALPIPTQVVSNGEYMPWPQTPAQRRVEHEIVTLADACSRRLRMDRRRFLRTASGLAASFIAMNRVFGPFFAVTPAEAADPTAARERAAGLARQLVFDVQTHFVRDDFAWNGILELGEWAKRWNPALREEGVTMRRFKLENYLKEIFLDSETSLALVSSAPADDPANTILTSEQMAHTRALVNAVAGTRRLFCHGVIRPGHPGWLDDLDHMVERLKPDSWKGYTVGDPLSPSKWPWRMDDERVVYPGYERIAKSGIRIVCVHKGLVPPDYERTFPNWQFARVDDVGKAARDWPQLTFVIYHSGLKPFLTPPDESLEQFERTGRIDWVSDLAEVRAKHGVTNVYAELGTSFASSVVTHPRHCAAMLGILVKGVGADHVIWGTDSVWYGSPQWQIEAFRRIEIPDELQRKHGFAALGPADGAVKRAILGENAARLYGLDLRTAFASETLARDGIAAMRGEYEAAGPSRTNLAYGLVRARI
jgi:predicted TIM-barrel fold metal-dependent hydrolase